VENCAQKVLRSSILPLASPACPVRPFSGNAGQQGRRRPNLIVVILLGVKVLIILASSHDGAVVQPWLLRDCSAPPGG
jgi:hypothetical protein